MIILKLWRKESMNYYHNLTTQRSWRELQKLRKELDFVLIGGWATYLHSQSLKSKDIDIIIDFNTLGLIRKKYPVSKNDRLHKYEIHLDGIDVDIYLPHYSSLGIPVENLLLHTINIQGFKVLQLSNLIALKLYTLSQRGRSPKGRKDFIDLLSLLTQTQASTKTEVMKIKQILAKYNLLDTLSTFQQMLTENNTVSELNLNQHKYAKVKKELENKFELKGSNPVSSFAQEISVEDKI